MCRAVNMLSFEDEYLDVLQNIEMAIALRRISEIRLIWNQLTDSAVNYNP